MTVKSPVVLLYEESRHTALDFQRMSLSIPYYIIEIPFASHVPGGGAIHYTGRNDLNRGLCQTAQTSLTELVGFQRQSTS